MPLLSIFIPSYNYAQYLSASIDSILDQDFKDYEIIIIDDGSTDESPQIAEQYAAKHPQIRYVRHEENKGFFRGNREVIDLAKGIYFHSFSADDLYLPGFLSKSMEVLLNHPKINLVCSDISYFGDKTEAKRLLPVAQPQLFTTDELVTVLKTTDFRVPGASCIVKKELFQKYGGMNPKLENISDWFLYHNIALFEGLAYIPETLLTMRVHNQTYTNQVKRDKKRRRATYWYLLDLLSKRENREARDRFIQSGLLKFISRELSWKLLRNPKYWIFR